MNDLLNVPVTLQNYLQLAMRTNSTVSGTFDIPPDLVHATLGLADEFFEYSIAKNNDERREELQDSFWFVALACHGFKMSQPQIDYVFNPLCNSPMEEENPIGFLGTMEYELGEFLGPMKKWYSYGAARSAEWAVMQLRKVVLCLFERLDYITTFTREVFIDELQSNIDKLRARFPDKFTVEHALNRDTDAEYAAAGLVKSGAESDAS